MATSTHLTVFNPETEQMGILAPLALAAIPLLAIIIALYLLKLRRPMAPVASLHLWESLTRDREANSLWQRLRVSLLLLMQLLALGILILALARPWVATSEPVGQHAIIVVDVSASMGATDSDDSGQTTRLDAAKSRASSIVDNLPQDGTATLLSSDTNASVVVPATGDRARLRDAIGRLAPQAAGTDMSEAIRLASVMVARQPNSNIWVLSDGAFPPVRDAAQTVPAALDYVKFGRGATNQGITALSLQQQAGSLQLFAQIVNADVVTATRRLDLSVDDQPWTARSVVLAPGATQELLVDDVPLQGHVVKALLSGQDSLVVDDSAWVVNRASAPASVLLVTTGDKFLELALSLLPSVNLYKLAPIEYKPSETINGAPVDLTIFDAGTPANLLGNLPSGNVMLVAPEVSSSVITVTGVVTEPVPSVSASEDQSAAGGDANQGNRDPLLRFVQLSPVHIAKAVHLALPQWGRPVLSSDKGPLIVAGEDTNRRKMAVLAFDPHDSDLPVQTAFPLLMRNLVTYLLPDPAGGLSAQVAPGTSVGIDTMAAGVDKIVVEDPSAKQWTFAVQPGRGRVAYAETAQPGVYYVSQYKSDQLTGQEAFAVNLFVRDESMIEPNASPGLPEAVPAEISDAAAQDGFKREFWPTVALAGFFLLLLEWAYAQRIAIRRAVTEWRTRRALSRVDRT